MTSISRDPLPFRLPPTAQQINDAWAADRAENQAKINDHSWMSSPSGHPCDDFPLPVDFGALCLIDGRPFINRQQILSIPVTEIAFKHFLTFFDHILQLNQKDPNRFAKYQFASHWDQIKTCRDQLEQAQKCPKELMHLSYEGIGMTPEEQNRLVDRYAETLRDRFKGNEAKWYPLSSNSPIMIKIDPIMIKIDPKAGHLTLVNTGGAAKKYHPQISQVAIDPLTGELKEKTKFQEFVKISNINKNRLLHIDFFKFLIEVQTSRNWNEDSRENVEQLYESMASYLEGTIEPGINPHESPDVYKTIKDKDGFLFKTLSTWLHTMLGSTGQSAYKQLNFMLQSQALTTYCKQLAKERKAGQPVKMMQDRMALLSDMVEHVSRKAEKLYKSNLLDQEDFDAFHATVMDIQHELSFITSEPVEEKRTDPIPCDLDQPSPAELGPISFPSRDDSAGTLLGPTLPVTKQTPLRECINHLENKQFRFDGKPKEIIDELRDSQALFSNTCQQIKNLYRDQRITSDHILAARPILLDKFSQFVCALPDLSKKKIPQKRVAECMETIYSLMQVLEEIVDLRHYGPGLPRLWGDRYHEADTTAMVYTLYSMNVRLARTLNHTRLDGFKLNHQELLEEVRSPQFIIQNPRLQKKLQEVISYFDPDFNLESQVEKEDEESEAKGANQCLFKFPSGKLKIPSNELKKNVTVNYYKQFLKGLDSQSELGKKLYHPQHGGKISYTEDFFDQDLGRFNTLVKTRSLRPQDSDLQHLEALINDPKRGTDEGFLPKEVYLLQDSALLCQMHHYGVKTRHSFTEGFTTQALSNNDLLTIEPISTEWRWNPRGSDSADDGLTKLILEEWNDAYTLVRNLKHRRKQNELIPFRRKLFNLEQDAAHELQMIGVDPYGAVAHLISFGRRNIHLLENPKVLEYFRLHLFRQGQLLSQMEDHPGFVASLASFFAEAIDHYCQIGDLTTCIDLAKLGNDLQVFIAQAGYDIPWVYEGDEGKKAVNFRKIVRENLISQVDKNEKMSIDDKWAAKRQMYEILVSFYEKVETETFLRNGTALNEAAIDLLELQILQKMDDQELGRSDAALSVILRLKPIMIDTIFNDTTATGFRNRNKIFDTVIKLINPAYSPTSSWAGGPRLYRSADYSIDIEEGTVIHNRNGEVGKIPSQITDHEDFRKLFKGKIVTSAKTGSAYLINEGMENELSVFETTANDLGFERSINGRTHRYIPTPRSLVDMAPTLEDPSLCCWVCNETDSLVVLDGDKEVCNGELAAGAMGANEHYNIRKITKVDDQNRVLQLLPQDCVADTLDMLLHLPANNALDRRHAECWIDAGTQDLVEIKCLELGLTFTVETIKGEKRFISHDLPGYYLVKNPEISLLDRIKYLTFENEAGDRKVIIPREGISKNGLGEIYQSLTPTVDHSLNWLAFDFDGQALQSKSNQGKLALMTLLVFYRHYDQAFALLKKINSLDRFKDEPSLGLIEKSAIWDLLDMLTYDKHPAARSMLIQVLLLLEENRLKYPSSKKTDDIPVYRRIPSSNLLNIYKDYAANAANASNYRLSDKQENAFVIMIEKTIDLKIDQTQGLLNKFKAWVEATLVRYCVLRNGRVDYLQQGVTKLGTKIKSNLARALELFAVRAPKRTGEELYRKFSTYQREQEFVVTQSVIVPRGYFEEHFFALYHLVRSGTAEQKAQIDRLLKLNKHLNSPDALILERVGRNPSRYPTVEELEAAAKACNEKSEASAAAGERLNSAKDSNWRYTKRGDQSSEKAKSAAKRLRKAQTAYDKASRAAEAANRKKAALFESICLSKIDTALFTINLLWKAFSVLVLSGFSVKTQIYDFFYSRFKNKKYQKKSVKIGHTELNCDGKVLKEADQAFDTYFAGLFNRYFKIDPQKIGKNGDRLSENHPDGNIAKKLKEENLELDLYRKSLPETIPVYHIKEKVKLKDLQVELRKTADALKSQLKVQKTALTWQVNYVPQNADQSTLKRLHKIGQHHFLDWDDVRQLTLKGSVEEFQKKTDLDQEGAKKLMTGVSDYLIKASRYDQMQTVLQWIEKALEASSVKKRDLFIQNCAECLKLIRNYSPNITNMHQQWFEAANHYLYRKDQLDKQREILKAKAKELLAEMPTASGKTKTVAPSLNYEKTRQGKLAINTWPACLEMTNASDMKEQMETSFGRKIDRFTFNRSTNFTHESLEFLYQELVKDREEELPLSICSETLRSLELHFLMSLKLARKKDDSEMKDRLGSFIKILREIRCYGWSAIDESHITLDPKDKLIYTLGDAANLPSKQIDILEECFRELINGPLASKIDIFSQSTRECF